MAWAVPVSSSTGSAIVASAEKRPTTPASSGARSDAGTLPVAVRSASTSTAIPPSHALTASTCRMFAGAITTTGDCSVPWPPNAGSSASAPSGTASA